MIMLHLETVSLDVIHVLAVVIRAMMYIAGVIYLLVVEAAELEMEYNVQIMLNCLSNIVNCKFGNQCIYYNLHKNRSLYSLHKYYRLYKKHNLHKVKNQLGN